MKFTGERVVPNAMRANVDTYQQHLARYVWALKYAVMKNVVDAACGTGYGTALIASIAKNVTGLDISQEAITYAEKYYSCDNVHFHKQDLEDCGTFVLKHFDVVVSFETIEHLNNPEKFLTWCKEAVPEVIGSIPINCPTPWHKHVWDGEQILTLLHKQFGKITFWHQDELNITKIDERSWEPLSNSGMILFRGLR